MTERPRNPEHNTNTKKFTTEARNFLDETGRRIYTLRKQSINSLIESGMKFWSSGPDEEHPDLEQFATLTSMNSQVAINPNRLFLENSNEWAYGKEEEMIANLSKDLVKENSGIKAVIGEVPDYAALAFAHFDETQEELFGKKHDYGLTITKTPFETRSDTRRVLVGDYDQKNGLFVGVWGRGRGGNRGRILVAPLLVPA